MAVESVVRNHGKDLKILKAEIVQMKADIELLKNPPKPMVKPGEGGKK